MKLNVPSSDLKFLLEPTAFGVFVERSIFDHRIFLEKPEVLYGRPVDWLMADGRVESCLLSVGALVALLINGCRPVHLNASNRKS